MNEPLPKYGINTREMLALLDLTEHIVIYARDRPSVIEDCDKISTILKGSVDHGIIIPERTA